MSVLTADVIAALAARVDDIVAIGDLDDCITRVEMGELADGSRRPFALVTTVEHCLDHVYRIIGPAADGAPAWASREWTLEARDGYVDPGGQEKWERLEGQPGEPPIFCSVHEAGACPPGCLHAYSLERPSAMNPVIHEYLAPSALVSVDGLLETARIDTVARFNELSRLIGGGPRYVSVGGLERLRYKEISDAAASVLAAAAAAYVLSSSPAAVEG